MNIEKYIKQFSTRCSYYSFKLNNYIIPKFIENDIEIIDIEKIIKEQLSNNNKYINLLQNEINNIKRGFPDCDKRLFSYIRKFPIIIDNKKLWNKVLNLYGVQNSDPLRNIDYFLLDIMFPISGLNISMIYDDKDNREKLIKNIENKYIKLLYNIETISFIKFGESETRDKIGINYIKDVLTKEKSEFLNRINDNNSTIYIDYSDIISENFKKNTRNLFKFSINLIHYIGEDNFELSEQIIITEKDLNNINLIEGSVLCNDIETKQKLQYIEDIFGKKIIVYKSNKYSIKEVIWAMNEYNNPKKWDNLLGKTIPRWIVKLWGYPPPKYTSNPNQIYRININNESSDRIEDLIKLITSMNS